MDEVTDIGLTPVHDLDPNILQPFLTSLFGDGRILKCSTRVRLTIIDGESTLAHAAYASATLHIRRTPSTASYLFRAGTNSAHSITRDR